jgi:hypothetical protein
MKPRLGVFSLIALLLLIIQVVHAAAAPGYTLDWWTVDNGGGTSQAGTYSLSGTVGQAEPGALHGGVYSLVGGFWANLQAALEKLFLPLVLRE